MSLSGPSWVAQFPGSRSTDDLAEPFRTNAENFLAALSAAGADVTISATLRPPQRAFLMHYAFLVAKGQIDPDAVPAMDGVDIDWVHTDANDDPDLDASISAASAMVAGYGIVYAPVLASRHTQGLAIDMTITWQSLLIITDGNGIETTISTLPRSGANPDLHNVGETFGVIKLLSDPPHWSSDGH